MSYFYCEGCNKRKSSDQLGSAAFGRQLCKPCAKRVTKSKPQALTPPAERGTGGLNTGCPWWVF